MVERTIDVYEHEEVGAIGTGERRATEAWARASRASAAMGKFGPDGKPY